MSVATQSVAIEQVPFNVLQGLTEEERLLYERMPEAVDWVDHPSFHQAGAEEQLTGAKAKDVDVPRWKHHVEVDGEIPATPRKSVLTPEEEVALFLRYNYARYRLAGLLDDQRRRELVFRAKGMVLWYKQILLTRAKLVHANLALVLAMAKRTQVLNVEFCELVSEGNMALLRSVERFDVSRGFKFSTYACRAISKSFNRLAKQAGRYYQFFPTDYKPEMERSDQTQSLHETQRKEAVDSLREILAENRARLSDIEKTVVTERFALDARGRMRTLAEVGRTIGVTNERVRQIQSAAIRKIRGVLKRQYMGR